MKRLALLFPALVAVLVSAAMAAAHDINSFRGDCLQVTGEAFLFNRDSREGITAITWSVAIDGQAQSPFVGHVMGTGHEVTFETGLVPGSGNHTVDGTISWTDTEHGVTSDQKVTFGPFTVKCGTLVSTPGPTGPKGDKGDTGAAGLGGSAGPKGDTGPPGPAGSAGPKGDTGAAGPKGAQGPKGNTGATGTTGPAGPAGKTGPAGARGARGPGGAQGPRGSHGPAGPAGKTGPAGKCKCHLPPTVVCPNGKNCGFKGQG